MSVLLIITATCIICIWLALVTDDSYRYDVLTPVLAGIAVITGIVSICMWIGIPVCRNESARNIQALEATRQTVNKSRKTEIDPLERATLTREVIEWNAWLAKEKFDNTHLWDAYVVDEIMEVQPIE